MVSSPSHVAVLVPSVRKAADYFDSLQFDIGVEETFEETREIYVQGGERNSLLLMEPKGPGSYEKAIKKRGPGIHHFAVDGPRGEGIGPTSPTETAHSTIPLQLKTEAP